MKLSDLDVTLNTGAVEWVISTEIDGVTYALALEDPGLMNEDAIRRTKRSFRRKFADLLVENGLVEDSIYEINLWAADVPHT